MTRIILRTQGIPQGLCESREAENPLVPSGLERGRGRGRMGRNMSMGLPCPSVQALAPLGQVCPAAEVREPGDMRTGAG